MLSPGNNWREYQEIEEGKFHISVHNLNTKIALKIPLYQTIIQKRHIRKPNGLIRRENPFLRTNNYKVSIKPYFNTT